MDAPSPTVRFLDANWSRYPNPTTESEGYVPFARCSGSEFPHLIHVQKLVGIQQGST